MQVETILQAKGREVFTVEAGAPLSEAVRLLNTHKIGAVVVVDAKGKVAGILSERDIEGGGSKLYREPRGASQGENLPRGMDRDAGSGRN